MSTPSSSPPPSSPAGHRVRRADQERLAAMLVAAGFISSELADQALQVQQAQGRWLGHLLLEMGAVTPRQLASILGAELNLRTVDLSALPVEMEAVEIIPETVARRFGVLGVARREGRLQLAVVNPLDEGGLALIRQRTGLELELLVVVESQMGPAIAEQYGRLKAAGRLGAELEQWELDVAAEQTVETVPEVLHVDDLLYAMQDRGASDLHLCAGSQPALRIDGELVFLPLERLSPDRIQHLVYSILNDEQVTQFEQTHELDFAYSVPSLSRFRVNVHRQRGSVGAAFRAVPHEPPSLKELAMPEVIRGLCHKPRGLVLVTGPTGSGKSTTLAAMIREINETRRCHVVTIEDPIEFLHRNNQAIVIQREVGADTKSFNLALRHVLRQDPDVILIGEMRDLETIAAAMTAAETGHLVLATLHTTSAAQTVDRVIDVFPPHQQEQIRVQLAGVLEGIICQSLLPLSEGRGRTCAQEILIATPGIRNLVREGKTHQIYSMLQSGGQLGMQTLDQALKKLVLSGKITPDDAALVSGNPAEFHRFLTMQ